MDKNRMVDLIIRYEDEGLNDEEFLELFSHLIKTGKCWTTQGHYGRTAEELIENGYISEDGEILEQRTIDLDILFTDYMSGEVFEKLENEDIDIYEDNYQVLDLMTQFYNHRYFKQAEEIADKKFIDLDFYWDDVFVRVEGVSEEQEDKIQNLVDRAWKEVRKEKYFREKVLNDLDEEVLQVLGRIYY